MERNFERDISHNFPSHWVALLPTLKASMQRCGTNDATAIGRKSAEKICEEIAYVKLRLGFGSQMVLLLWNFSERTHLIEV
ncbi:unnamed protein product [Litomosoides sigmodontis]|uniref:Uncharacterized protein n=1 Tax=Litomosoides sigmodontis TaxID=42156 RepID=A0A3P6U4B3_LITSI|nr:unnamed protein product [Litomosoides sigmodontis]